jgi:Uma2 family endonuclease
MGLTAAQLADLMPDATQLESNEPEMESSQHYWQLLLLVTCLESLWHDRDDFFLGANLTIYFSRQQLKNRDFRGPDLFLVRPTQKQPRKSWVVWEEDGRYPNLIIELLSDSTAEVDRTLKKALYQDRFHTPEYFWFSPETLEFAGFSLVGGVYQSLPTTPEGYRWSDELQLFLGIHDGKLRYFTPTKQLVPTPEERSRQAETEARQAETKARQAETEAQQAQTKAQQAQTEVQRLAAKLRSLGIDPAE